MGYYDGIQNRKPSEVEEISVKQGGSEYVPSQWSTGVKFILRLLFILGIFVMIFGLLISIGKINGLTDFQTIVFPFLYKNLIIMSIITVLMLGVEYTDKRMQKKEN